FEVWLEARGAKAERPAHGSARAEHEIAVVAASPVAGVARDAVIATHAAGFTLQGERLARAVVSTSPGASPHLFGVARDLLSKTEEQAALRAAPRLAALEARSRSLLDDAKAKPEERALVLVEIADTLRQAGSLK